MGNNTDETRAVRAVRAPRRDGGGRAAGRGSGGGGGGGAAANRRRGDGGEEANDPRRGGRRETNGAPNKQIGAEPTAQSRRAQRRDKPAKATKTVAVAYVVSSARAFEPPGRRTTARAWAERMATLSPSWRWLSDASSSFPRRSRPLWPAFEGWRKWWVPTHQKLPPQWV